MGIVRSLTASEKAGLRMLDHLRAMGLISPDPYDVIEIGDITHAGIRSGKHMKEYSIHDRRRKITYRWGKDPLRQEVRITLGKSAIFRKTEDIPSLADEKGDPWRAVNIQIIMPSFDKEGEDIISFSGALAISRIYDFGKRRA